jgi:hypothetical protein
MKNNGKRKRKHRKEVMALFEQFKEKFPVAVREEIVAEGEYFTLARVSAMVNDGFIIGEGLARRSGELGADAPDSIDPIRAKTISLGRAQVSCAMKLASHKPWVKLRNLLMA